MKSVFDPDNSALPEGAPTRYHRYGLGPVRPAPKEGKGWLFAAGELAMTASDLAKWNISLMNSTLLKPQSYTEMERPVLLQNGASTQYGLGVSVSLANSHRVISHGGEVSGFTAQNAIYPDDHASETVLTSLDASRAAGSLARKIGELLFAPTGDQDSIAKAKTILTQLQKGKIDRSPFTDNANAYFSSSRLDPMWLVRFTAEDAEDAESHHSTGKPSSARSASSVVSLSSGKLSFWAVHVREGRLTSSSTRRAFQPGQVQLLHSARARPSAKSRCAFLNKETR